MAERKETAARDKNGVRKQNYKRFQEGKDYESTEAETTIALCDMFRRGFLGAEQTEVGGEVRRKPGRPPKYETVESFVDVVTQYIDYIESKAAEGVHLIPDIEGFCSFAGISRETLNEWEKTRHGAYSDTIKSFKTSVAAYKKQLALNGKIPPIVFATDFNNNHGYVQQHTLEVQATKKLEELPNKSEIVRRLPPSSTNSGIDADIEINLNDEP